MFGLEIVIPKIVDISTNDWLGYEKMAILGENPNERYSDMYDEIQVKNSVPLELMTGITMPIHCMNKSLYDEKKNIDIIIKELEKIKELLLLHGYNIPIYDIDTFLKLNDEETVKTLVKYYNKKYRG